MSGNQGQKDEVERIKYLRDTNVHHLFELLASRVLSHRPQDVYSFLRQQIEEIERSEKRSSQHKHDPHQIPRRSLTPNESEATMSPATETPVTAMPTTSSIPSSSQPEQMKLTLAMFGLDDSGKTALIHAIDGNPNQDTSPTVGFTPNLFETDACDVCVFDLGGAASFRSIWRHYYHDVHGVMFVVDGSNEKRLDEAAHSLAEVMKHQYMLDKPVLIFINKCDKPGFLGVEQVTARLNIAGYENNNNNNNNNGGNVARPVKILPVCAIREDAGVDQGVEWLLESVKAKFDALSRLVEVHSKEVKEAKKKALAEQAKRVAADKEAEEAAKKG